MMYLVRIVLVSILTLTSLHLTDIACAEAIAQAAPPAGEIKHATDVSDLPLQIVAAEGKERDVIAVLYSGDGGWAGLDRDIASYLAKKGITVVGVDSRKYFWQRKTPQEGGRDLSRILQRYLVEGGNRQALLIGYSLGADALVPFLLNVPEELQRRIPLAALIGPGVRAELEFHFEDWIENDNRRGFPLRPEVQKLRQPPLLCLYGSDDSGILCPQLTAKEAVVVAMPGDHHFNGDYAGLAQTILAHAGLDKKE